MSSSKCLSPRETFSDLEEELPDWAVVPKMLKMNKLVPMLLDLMLYDSPSLVWADLALIFRLCSIRKEVSLHLKETQILFDKTSQSVFEEMCKQAMVLKEMYMQKMSNHSEKQACD